MKVTSELDVSRDKEVVEQEGKPLFLVSTEETVKSSLKSFQMLKEALLGLLSRGESIRKASSIRIAGRDMKGLWTLDTRSIIGSVMGRMSLSEDLLI